MRARFDEAGKQKDQPEIHLRAARTTQYEVIAQVMGAAQQAGLERIGFVTQPPADPNERRSSGKAATERP
jgi:biopolymer transport protein ExbD